MEQLSEYYLKQACGANRLNRVRSRTSERIQPKRTIQQPGNQQNKELTLHTATHTQIHVYRHVYSHTDIIKKVKRA